MILPSGYYTSSRKNSNAIAFRKGDNVYPFEQFDLQFNRPDILLATFNQSSVRQRPEGAIDGVVSFRSLRTMSWGETAALSDIEQMKSLFAGLRKSTGATIVASAGSVQYAMEGPEWNNSVFAYAFLKGIREGQADLNYDGVITISELQEYLPRKVSQLTRGGQLPTYRYENIQNDWRIW
ncbi:MAG: hypothetical protein J5I98_03485 [Phaeodactylibacter sp.]|nr:hypothetical protein [Phaeodactylibacter sp.]